MLSVMMAPRGTVVVEILNFVAGSLFEEAELTPSPLYETAVSPSCGTAEGGCVALVCSHDGPERDRSVEILSFVAGSSCCVFNAYWQYRFQRAPGDLRRNGEGVIQVLVVSLGRLGIGVTKSSLVLQGNGNGRPTA